jgi:hypothetical protein
LRRRSQSVLPADFAPIDFTFSPCREPGRDDAPEILAFFDVSDEDFFVLGDADRSPAFFVIGNTSVDPLDDLPIEYTNGIPETDAVFANVRGVLR